MSRIALVVRLTCLLLVCCTGPSFAANPQEQFREAVNLLEDKNFEDALPLLKALLDVRPDDLAVLWNFGIAAAELNENNQALTAWQRYKEIDPGDWRVRAKLIQSYQALGRTVARDVERSALIALREKGEDEDLVSAERYCREQFLLNGVKHFVFEYFEPSGDWPVFYAFIAVDDSGYEAYRVSLGSYNSTNEIAWELGEIPKSKRLYHLDRYEGEGHSTLGFYQDLPDYDQIRTVVLSYLGESEASK